MAKQITGNLLRDMMLSGAANMEKNKAMVNDLNVFPVPDGDTGTNMSMTIGACVAELSRCEGRTTGEIAKITATNLLKGARGNSGVILSLIFRGFAKGLSGKDIIDGRDIALSLTTGVAAAYKAVMKPTEGTILTVARVAAERATALAETESDSVAVFEEILRAAEETLAKTPEMLPVLKQANVVDAGGKGLITIFEGMLSVLRDGVMIEAGTAQETEKKADFTSFDGENIKFAYCTEFIVNITPDKRLRDPMKLRAFLELIGDSVVVAPDDDFIKCHVHTNNPGKALEEAIKYGFLSNMKIENMKEQLAAKSADDQAPEQRVIAAPEKKYGFVAVSAGEGISDVFRDLSVDQIAFGGQTMNPSTEDILKCIDATPAETVFVLPNNKNIIMAAEMAIPLSEKQVIVLPTKTIPQGVSAMLAFDESADVEQNREAMLSAALHVKSGQITYAVRDSVFDGKTIKEGELLCLLENKVKLVEKSLEKAAVKLADEMVTKDDSYMIIFYGADVTEAQAQEIEALVQKKVGSGVEITLVNGGQSVYYFIFSVE